MKIYLHYTYHKRKRSVTFQVHIFTQHEEMLGLITDTLSLKPTVSAIICENNKTYFLHFSQYFPQSSILSDRNLA